MPLFNKEKETTQVMPMEKQKELNQEAGSRDVARHAVAASFERAVNNTVQQEWTIFETRLAAVCNLTEDASKVEVKRAISRVKRASMDVRDALKELGRFTIEK